MSNDPDPESAPVSATGRCECGGVRFALRGPLRGVLNCHCGQCRRTHGHVGAYTRVEEGGLELREDAELRWYRSSDGARRGFCGRCGASLFFHSRERGGMAVSAGTLDEPTRLQTVAHVYVDHGGDYYRIDDGLPRYPGMGPWPAATGE